MHVPSVVHPKSNPAIFVPTGNNCQYNISDSYLPAPSFSSNSRNINREHDSLYFVFPVELGAADELVLVSVLVLVLVMVVLIVVIDVVDVAIFKVVMSLCLHVHVLPFL